MNNLHFISLMALILATIGLIGAVNAGDIKTCLKTHSEATCYATHN